MSPWSSLQLEYGPFLQLVVLKEYLNGSSLAVATPSGGVQKNQMDFHLKIDGKNAFGDSRVHGKKHMVKGDQEGKLKVKFS